MDGPQPRVWRIGEYRFDARTGDLDGPDGQDRLPRRAALLLDLLADARGGLVDRDTMRDRLWPGGKVEFDQGINFLIRQLRKALGDDASEPRYIETLPRRGYRMVADVEEVGGDGSRPGGAARGRAAPRAADTAVPDPVPPPPPPPGRPRVGLLPVAAVAAVLLAGAVTLRSMLRPAPAEGGRVLAILPFDSDGAPGAAALGEALTVEATAARPGLRVLGPTVTAPLLASSAPVPAARGEVAACYVVAGGLRTTSDGRTAVFGQLLRTSDQAHLWARLDTVPSGEAPSVAGPFSEALAAALDADLADGRSDCPDG